MHFYHDYFSNSESLLSPCSSAISGQQRALLTWDQIEKQARHSTGQLYHSNMKFYIWLCSSKTKNLV